MSATNRPVLYMDNKLMLRWRTLAEVCGEVQDHPTPSKVVTHYSVIVGHYVTIEPR